MLLLFPLCWVFLSENTLITLHGWKHFMGAVHNQMLFPHLLIWSCDFLSLLLLMWCIMLIDLRILYNPCIPGMNPTWSWCMTFLMYCWMRFANILLRILASMSSAILAWSFLSSLCLYLVLWLVWCWLHKTSLGVFHQFGVFRIVCGG